MKKFVVAAALTAAFNGTGLAQDIEKGANVFKQCQACHSLGPSAQNKVGPELNGLDGRTAASKPFRSKSRPRGAMICSDAATSTTSRLMSASGTKRT